MRFAQSQAVFISDLVEAAIKGAVVVLIGISIFGGFYVLRHYIPLVLSVQSNSVEPKCFSTSFVY